ncbi:MAG TPA: transporter substrate-binding domain-containing protein [Gemmatimonadaceae bacterium]
MIRRQLMRSLAALAAAALVTCRSGEASRDWAAIQQSDTLMVLTTFNSTSYFIYRGEPMGLEYELLRDFAADNDLALRISVLHDQSELLSRLRAGEGDVVAARVIPTAELQQRFGFTRPLYSTRPALVQRTGPPAEARLPAAAESLLDWRNRTPAAPVQVRARPITTPAELAGTSVSVVARSPYRAVLAELSDSLTGDIEIIEVAGDSATETLVRQVARGEIDLAVSQENLAQLKQSYFQNIEVVPAIAPPHPVAWAVRRSSPDLRRRLDEWLEMKSTDGTLERLYNRYFIDRRGYRERVESDYLTSTTGRLSAYDALFRQHAPRIGWDWRLLAAQAYQESRFEPAARSWAGAQGILQLMPGTAREVGVRNASDPAENVAGAVRYLEQLVRRWTPLVADPTERLKFVLASYNTGPGHVFDAQRLAEKHGLDPARWDDVAFWLLQKSKRAVYTDPVVRHGFSRGLEPVLYVQKILERFEHYREFVPEGPA